MEDNKKIYTKVIFVGSYNAGKSSIICQYLTKKFPKPRDCTVGPSFYSKELLVDNRYITLEIWDTCGQERFGVPLHALYYRNTKCCVLCFDVNSLQSFQSLDKWKNEFLTQCNSDNAEIVLLGNKIDLNKNNIREVSKEMAESWCNLNKYNNNKIISYFEVSATGINIEEAFKIISKKALDNYDLNNLIEKKKIEDLETNSQKPSSTCCSMVIPFGYT